MSNNVSRIRIIVLLLLLTVSGFVEAISRQTKAMLISTAVVCSSSVVGFARTKIQRRWRLREIELYSADELANLKRIVEPYVSANDLNNILGCVRKPKYLSHFIAPCSFNNCIIIDPRLLLPTTCNLTDTEFAYLVLHEYGHVINGHVDALKDVTKVLKGLSLQLSLIALQIYKPKMNHAKISFMTSLSCTLGTILLQRKDEYTADDYAFNALKIDAPAGCVSLEKIYKQCNYTLYAKINEKPLLRSRIKMAYFDKAHPTLWSRYQHACRVAAKYGWNQK